MGFLLPPYYPGTLALPDGAELPYVMIGEGKLAVLVIAGAGDGLTTVRDGALQLAWFYRHRAKTHRILLLSRRQPIPPGFSMAQHADDTIYGIEALGWPPSVLECNSAGGPVGQWIAVKRPDRVRGLILSVSLHYSHPKTRQVIETWLELARRRDWRALNWSSIEYTFTPQRVRRYRLARPLLGLLPKPRYPERLERIFASLLDFDNRPILPLIQVPTLVIGGEEDRVIPAEVQRDMAVLIPNSRLSLHPHYGHGNDQENPAYEIEARQFIREMLCSDR